MAGGRDRRGRGRRGPLAWPRVPAMLTRGEAFDELVLDSAKRYQSHLERRGRRVELLVDDVPPAEPAPWEDGPALARVLPGEGQVPPRIVIYRRPVEALAAREGELPAVVGMVVARQVAELLGVEVEDIDPGLA